jgi:hypothetical protein
MAIKYNNHYDPKYKWRPTMYWDHCPACFENFDIGYKCDNCGLGHDDYNNKAPDPEVKRSL